MDFKNYKKSLATCTLFFMGAITYGATLPQLSGIETSTLTHVENNDPISLTNTTILVDPDNSISSATISITSNYRKGQDILYFKPAGTITHSFNASTGVLTLTGVTTVADYQTAIRNVKYYQRTAYQFYSSSARTVSIVVNDGTGNSNTVTRTIAPAPHIISAINYGEAVQKYFYFFEAQKSGALPERGNLATQNRVEWRGNSLMKDGSDVNVSSLPSGSVYTINPTTGTGIDLTGGWYDAGDTYKCATTMAYAATYTAWAGSVYNTQVTALNQKPYLLENLRFINDYFLKCFVNDQPGNYVFYTQVTDVDFAHSHWAAPEVLEKIVFSPANTNKSYRIDVGCKGSDAAGHVAATFAASSIVFRQAGETVYANKLLDKARKMFLFGDTYKGVDGHRNAAGTITKSENYVYRNERYEDEMMLAASWLHKAELAAGVSTANYLQKARGYYDAALAASSSSFTHWKENGVGEPGFSALVNLIPYATGQDLTDYTGKVQNWLDWWTIGYSDAAQYTPGGLSTKKSSNTEHIRASLRFSTTHAMIAGIYSDHLTSGATPATAGMNVFGASSVDRKSLYNEYAKRQAAYALGDNPYGRSYVIGTGLNPWGAAHHRAAYGPWAGFEHFISGKPEYNIVSNKHILYGALLGGPQYTDGNGIATDYFDYSKNNVTNATSNEVALDFNAGLLGAFARMYKQFPGNGSELAGFPAAAVKEDEFFVEASTSSSSTASSVNVKVQINNRSKWPARSSNKLSTRYFFTLDAGVTAADVSATLASGTANTNTQGAAIGPVTLFGNNIYYVEVNWNGTDIFPGGLVPATNTRNNVYWMREANFTLSGPAGWKNDNDWSFTGLNGTLAKSANLPVYDNGIKIFGSTPTGSQSTSPGPGYVWKNLTTSTTDGDNTTKFQRNEVSDGAFTDYKTGNNTAANNRQALGIIWTTTRTNITSVKLYSATLTTNGWFTPGEAVRVQYQTTAGGVWTDVSGWSITTNGPYPYSNAASTITYTFSGPAITQNVIGIRVIGQVLTNGGSAAVWFREVEVLTSTTPPAKLSINDAGKLQLNLNTVAEKITVFPNPVTDGYLTVGLTTADKNNKVDVSLSDLSGRIVYKSNFVSNGNSQELNIGKLKPGIYMIRMKGPNTDFNSKVVVE